jgi:hypothetical protein
MKTGFYRFSAGAACRGDSGNVRLRAAEAILITASSEQTVLVGCFFEP